MQNARQAGLSALTMAALCFLAAGCGKKNIEAQVKSDLQKRYDAEAVALARKDANAALAVYAPDFTAINQNGKTRNLSRERLSMERAFAAPVTDQHFVFQIGDVHLENAEGTQATVRVTHHITGTVTAGGQNGALVIDSELRDFWVKGGSGWHLKREKIISINSTVDGKSFK